jgi:4-hydroxybenzoate polyprenyltransferase/phosphoserine phosphatase
MGDTMVGLPLCVDLDGTLIRSDTLIEGVFALSCSRQIAPSLLRLAREGRAGFKQAVARHAVLDPALLPYNQELLAYLRRQKEAGREIVLVTAADRAVADAIAAHLGLFDAVLASDGTRNLKGSAKAEALCARYGRKGFVYAGNARSDLAVWGEAGAIILVDTPGDVAARARTLRPVEAEFAGREPAVRAALRAMRPHQWVKNLLVFIPIVTSHELTEPGVWLAAMAMFIAFCAVASAIYIVNDLTDLAADRRHPRKRLRPFASGALDPLRGIALSALLGGLGLVLALWGGTFLVIAAYAVASLSYSLALKEQPLVDVFLLAGLYTIRLYGGGVATGHSLSLWLLGFSVFLFLGLALLKRVEELRMQTLRELQDAASGKPVAASRRGYLPGDAAILQVFGCSASFASSLVLALFVQREATADLYASPGLLWGIVPLMLFWQCRLWLSTARGYMHDDPIIYASRDWVSWIVGACVLAVLFLAWSNPFGLL